MRKSKIKICPACLHEKASFGAKAGEGSAYSRYVSIYICSECGVKEAWQGFFWHERCDQRLLNASAKRRGISVKELIEA